MNLPTIPLARLEISVYLPAVRSQAGLRPRGGVVTQRTANPCTPVRFRARPPDYPSTIADNNHAAQAVSAPFPATACILTQIGWLWKDQPLSPFCFPGARLARRRSNRTTRDRRQRLTSGRSCESTSSPNGLIQKPSTGRNPRIPPKTSVTPKTMRAGARRGK